MAPFPDLGVLSPLVFSTWTNTHLSSHWHVASSVLGALLPRTPRLFSTASNMKRDATLVQSPPKPARHVHVRLSQADTQTALPPPELWLSQVSTLAASTPFDLDSPETQDPAVATC